MQHARQRKILSNAFSDKALKEQEPLLKRWTEKMRDKIAEAAKDQGKVDMLKVRRSANCPRCGDGVLIY